MVTAYTAWDVQSLADGRFVLGLGTQVKGHIERRFDVEWDSPGPRLREYVEVLREIWASWEEDRHPSYGGEFYSITLCPADWRPEPIEHSHVPIYIAGVNSYNVTLAGECCDGLHVHPLNSPEYIEREVVPDIETGAARADRDPDDVTLVTNVFAITGETDAEREQAREEIRRQIAFYGSTRTYKRIFAVHGWENVCDDLHELSVEDRWDEMPALVTDEMVETFSVEGTYTTNSETRSKSGTPISIGSRCTRRTAARNTGSASCRSSRPTTGLVLRWRPPAPTGCRLRRLVRFRPAGRFARSNGVLLGRTDDEALTKRY